MEPRFLDSWLICGPFYSDRGWATLDEDYLFGEARVRPRKGSPTFGREWIEFDTADGFVQFLFAPFEHTLFCSAYAHTYVHSPADADAVLLCGSDDGIKAWLNGEVVWRNDVNRAAVPGEDRTPIRLRKGWNSLLVKVRQGMAHWQFCAQIADADGLQWAREADTEPEDVPASAVGVRVRFPVETYGLHDGGYVRDVQFEVGNIGSSDCAGVSLTCGSSAVRVGGLRPGETRIVSTKLPLDEVVGVMRGCVEVRADAPLEATVTLSESSRLLRDLFAPFYGANGRCLDQPPLFRGFLWLDYGRTEKGACRIADPPGLRKYLAGLVARFPMGDSDATEARCKCDNLLALALDGDTDTFLRVLAEAKLPPMEVK